MSAKSWCYKKDGKRPLNRLGDIWLIKANFLYRKPKLLWGFCIADVRRFCFLSFMQKVCIENKYQFCEAVSSAPYNTRQTRSGKADIFSMFFFVKNRHKSASAIKCFSTIAFKVTKTVNIILRIFHMKCYLSTFNLRLLRIFSRDWTKSRNLIASENIAPFRENMFELSPQYCNTVFLCRKSLFWVCLLSINNFKFGKENILLLYQQNSQEVFLG